MAVAPVPSNKKVLALWFHKTMEILPLESKIRSSLLQYLTPSIFKVVKPSRVPQNPIIPMTSRMSPTSVCLCCRYVSTYLIFVLKPLADLILVLKNVSFVHYFVLKKSTKKGVLTVVCPYY